MILRLENLLSGVRAWHDWGWGEDLINAEYTHIYNAKSEGVTPDWWQTTVQRLWDWRAIRSPTKPNSIAEIFAIGNYYLDELAADFMRIENCSPRPEPLFTDLEWDDIAGLFWKANSIKHGRNRHSSPVFASKLCHFLYPRVFPVMDNQGTGIMDYEFFWRGMRSELSRFPAKQDAVDILTSQILAQGGIVHPWYPFETKLIEICQIGYYQPLPLQPSDLQGPTITKELV